MRMRQSCFKKIDRYPNMPASRVGASKGKKNGQKACMQCGLVLIPGVSHLTVFGWPSSLICWAGVQLAFSAVGLY